MYTLDPEGQFYPFISTAITGNEHPLLVQCFLKSSFHEQSSTPPPLHSAWDIQYNPLKK